MPFDGPNLAALRRRRRLTQAELAERVGCHRVSLARWEAGTRQPTAEEIIGLAQALRARIDRMMKFNPKGEA